MDRHMRESLDHWLTTPPEEMNASEEDPMPDLKAAEEYASARYHLGSAHWQNAREAFLAGVEWQHERAANSQD